MLQPKSDGGGLPPVLQRMQKAYPDDLASGRFVSLADFESRGQVLLFRTVGADGAEGQRQQPTTSILHARNETGAGSLAAVLEGPDDRLLFDGKRSEQLALIRDWRKYALLLMSIYGPPGGVTLEFGVQSGEETPVSWTQTISVRPGWNLFRFDVATIGDRVDLGDVRALSWRASQATARVDLYLDDIILADNTRHVLGEDAGTGELYVLTRGRRIVVGVRDRFELAFADGLIVGWRDPGGENLADIGGLGPWPVPLAEDWFSQPDAPVAYDDPRLFAAWGKTVAAAQRLVEATAFRVVVEGRWRFGDAGESAPAAGQADARPGHTWRYVIYPAGQLCVSVRSEAPASGWAGPRVGYAMGLDGRRDFRRVTPPAADARTPAPSFVLMARPGAQRADLLWTWTKAGGLTRQRELVSADQRRLAVVAGDVEASPTVETAHLLRIWPGDIDAAPEGTGLAADYQNPAAITAMAGGLITDAAGDLDHDGFNESEGCYELAPVDGVLGFDFDPGRFPRFDPVFRVRETADRRCWVYARGRTVQPLGRDAQHNLLFTLGRVAGAPLGIEVNSAPQAGAVRAGALPLTRAAGSSTIDR